MRIVVFGASGRTGRQIVTQAVKRSHEVVAFVRDASKQWFPDAVTVHQGDPHDPKAVTAALAGADAAISALGPIAGVDRHRRSPTPRGRSSRRCSGSVRTGW